LRGPRRKIIFKIERIEQIRATLRLSDSRVQAAAFEASQRLSLAQSPPAKNCENARQSLELKARR
jgi:hypothetical protein